MFIYRGMRKVGRGVYWDPEGRRKIIIQEEERLPGPMDTIFYRLPHSYFLLVLLLVGLLCSMALPYGMGVVLFFGLLATAWIFWRTAVSGYAFVKGLLGDTAFFGFTPNRTFFTGKKKNRKKKDEKEDDTKTS